MSRSPLLVRAVPSVSLAAVAIAVVFLAAACGGSSSSGAPDDGASDPEEIAALRTELALAGVEPLPDPPAVSDELFALGQALFFDKVLSGNEDVSCATCHLPEFATGDGRTLSDGVHGIGLGPQRGGGAVIPRNSPSLLALHAKTRLFWDGRVQESGSPSSLPPGVELTASMRAVFSPGLEVLAAQAMLPPVSREEMRGEVGDNPLGDLGDGYNSSGGLPEHTTTVWTQLNERLLDLPGYIDLLQAAYPGVEIQDFTFAHAGNALAAFEARAFARTDSPFQRFVRGDDAALTRDQVNGGLAFFAAGCARCHSGPLLSDEGFHNTGLPQLGPGVNGQDLRFHSGPDLGREMVTSLVEDRFLFRTPSLHGVGLTGPWGHAGQFAELDDMVAHYRDVVLSHQRYDIVANVPDPVLALTQWVGSEQVLATLDPLLTGTNEFLADAVVEFLHALTPDDARDLSDVVPASVPSGLPVF
jgi:cytochrome c peroxidase